MGSRMGRACSALVVTAAMLCAAIGVSGPAHAGLTSGAYRITLHGDGNLWLRAFEGSSQVVLEAGDPPPGDGLWIWWLEPMGESDGEHFAIVNHSSRFALSAVARPGAVVGAEPESAASLRWQITAAGQDTYYLSCNGDLRADRSPVGSSEVVLQSPRSDQRWELRWVGDY